MNRENCIAVAGPDFQGALPDDQVTVVCAFSNEGGCYDPAWFESSCRSIAAQTYHGFRWFVSLYDDETEAAFDDPRVDFVRAPAASLMAARNEISQCVKTPYFMVQDGDDVYDPSLIEVKLRAALAHPDAVAVASLYLHMTVDGEPCPGAPDFDNLWGRAHRYEAGEIDVPPMIHGGALIKTEAFKAAGGYDGNRLRGGDTDLWVRLIEQGRFLIVPRVLFYYRRHGGQSINRFPVGSTVNGLPNPRHRGEVG